MSTYSLPHARERSKSTLTEADKVALNRLLLRQTSDAVTQARTFSYHQHHLRGCLDDVIRVQRAAVTIQRIVRGKIARKMFLNLWSARHSLRDLIIYVLYFGLHVLFSFIRKGGATAVPYYQSRNMEDLLIHEEFPGPADGGSTYIYKTFNDVGQESEIWHYLEGPFTANVFPDSCLMGERSGDDCLGILSGSNHIVGSIGLRQYRVVGKDCPLPETLANSTAKDQLCYGRYTAKNAESATYGEGLNTTETSDELELAVRDCFKHKVHPDTGIGIMSSGTYGWMNLDLAWTSFPTYEAYMCDINPQERPTAKFARLKELNWIDLATRGVLVDLSTYSRSTNIYTTTRLYFEFPETGGVVTYYETYSTTLLLRLEPTRYTCYWLVFGSTALFTLIYLAQEVWEIRHEGCKKYLQSMWNYADLVNYVLFLFVFGLGIAVELRSEAVLGTGGQLTDPGTYVNVYNYCYWSRMMDWIFSINFLIVLLKFFKYLKWSDRLSIYIMTLRQAMDELISFCLILVLLILIFTFAFWLSYGDSIWQFRHLTSSLYTCTLGIFAGEFSTFIEDAYYRNRFFGPIVFITFMFMATIVSMAMFIAMIEDAYESTKTRVKNNGTKDALYVQMVLQARRARTVVRRWQYRLCCRCCKPPEKDRHKLSREPSITEFLKPKRGSRVDPMEASRRMSQTKQGRKSIMNAFGIGDMQRQRRTDAASREDNTREGRMKNIEKTVMEILMRLENSLPKSIEGTFLDVTAVHYANMSNVKLRHDVTDGADDSASPGSAAVGSSKEQPQGAKDQAGRSGFFGDLDNLPGPKNSESAYVVRDVTDEDLEV